MINHDTANSAYFSIDSANALIVPTNPRGLGWNRYYLDGSAIGLYDCATNLQTRYLLKRSISFVFESCAWRGAIEGGETYNQTALEFLTHAASFLSSSTSTNAQQGASQFAMLVAMYGSLCRLTRSGPANAPTSIIITQALRRSRSIVCWIISVAVGNRAS